MRGKNRFIWDARLLPIGLPLAAASGIKKWVDSRSQKEAIGIAAVVLALVAIEAEIEFFLRRRTYRKNHTKKTEKRNVSFS